MSMFSSIKKAINGAPRLKKRHFDPEKMSIEDITLPVCLRGLDIEEAREFVKQEIDTYKSLNYVNLPLDQLKFPEYHSYQVGLILRYLKDDLVFLIPNIENIVPSIALHATKRQLHVKVFDMIYRYSESVPKDSLREELRKDHRWTPLEVAYLLRYLTIEDRMVPKKN